MLKYSYWFAALSVVLTEKRMKDEKSKKIGCNLTVYPWKRNKGRAFFVQAPLFIYGVYFILQMTPLLTKVAATGSESASSKYSELQKPEVVVPLCYMQTSDGRILDMQKLCGKTPARSRVSGSRFRRDCVSNKCGTNSQRRVILKIYPSRAT